MAAILNLPQISRLGKNNATLLKLHEAVEEGYSNISAKNLTDKYNRKQKNLTCHLLTNPFLIILPSTAVASRDHT